MRIYRQQINDSGNSLVEMLLFTPLAMLFLFAATDAGLALKDRSSVIDSVRSALSSHSLLLPADFALRDRAEMSLEAHRSLLNGLAETIVGNLSRARNGSTNVLPYLNIGLVVLDIDPQSGELTDYRIDKPTKELASSQQQHCSNTNLEGYLGRSLSVSSKPASSFAVPIAHSFRSTSERFLPQSYLLAVQICSTARGLSTGSASLLGKFYDFHEEQLIPLRVRPGAAW